MSQAKILAVLLASFTVFAQGPSSTTQRTEFSQNLEHVYRVGHGVSAPTLIYKKEPAYSEEAKRAQLQGKVALAFVVGRDGQAQKISVVRSLGLGLDERAIEALRTWKFKPGLKDGKDVPVYATADFNFCLPGLYCPTDAK